MIITPTIGYKIFIPEISLNSSEEVTFVVFADRFELWKNEVLVCSSGRFILLRKGSATTGAIKQPIANAKWILCIYGPPFSVPCQTSRHSLLPPKTEMEKNCWLKHFVLKSS